MVDKIGPRVDRLMENDLGYFLESFIYKKFSSRKNLDFIPVRMVWKILSKKDKNFLTSIDPWGGPRQLWEKKISKN